MKLGILTYHRSHNYGALLQSIALKKVLEDLGFEAYFVNYWPEYHRDMYRIISKRYMHSVGALQKIKSLISTGLRLPKILSRRHNFNKFINKHIDPYCISIKEHVDMVVCGSDQIWRKQPGLNYQFNPTYFGDSDINTECYVSYAASMGVISLNDLEKNQIKNWLNKFKRISVRERNLKDAVTDLGISDVEVSLDPTLLLEKRDWDSLISTDSESEKPYLLVYDLQTNIFNEEAIKAFAHERGLEIKRLLGTAHGFKGKRGEFRTAGPEEMVKLIANAEYVFTSSFHGLVFSIIYHKPFYASFRENSGRAESLLSQIDQRDRLIDVDAKIIPERSVIDYRFVDNLLKKQRDNSISYLKSLANI